MAENIDSMVSRIDQLEDTLKMSEELVDSTSAFADKAAHLKSLFFWKQMKVYVYTVVILNW